jgi:hypothetical protein
LPAKYIMHNQKITSLFARIFFNHAVSENCTDRIVMRAIGLFT